MDRTWSGHIVTGIAVAGIAVAGAFLTGCGPGVAPAAPAATLSPRAPVQIVAPATQGARLDQTPVTPRARRTPATPIPRMLALNTPLQARYIPGEVHELYVFESERPRRITVEMAVADGGSPLNLQAQLFDAAGRLIAPVAAEAGTPLLRSEWDLPAAGMYRVQVFGPEAGPRAFTLRVGTLPQTETGGGVLAYDETRSGAIRVRGQRDVWVFTGQAGDSVVIGMVAPQADAVLELYDPAGEMLALVDDNTEGQDAILVLTLPETGAYTLVAHLYGDDQTGAYQIRLERVR